MKLKEKAKKREVGKLLLPEGGGIRGLDEKEKTCALEGNPVTVCHLRPFWPAQPFSGFSRGVSTIQHCPS